VAGSKIAAAKAKELCQAIFSLDDILACTLVEAKGEILATKSKGLGEDRELRSRLGEVVAVIWGGIRGTIHIGGEMKMVIVVFEQFKSVAIPIKNIEVVILVTVPLSAEPDFVRGKILSCLSQFGWAS
jgi:ribosomal protein L25 (general stress protein Ctc)